MSVRFRMADQISFRPNGHRVPVPRVYRRPVVEFVAVLRDEDDVLRTGCLEYVRPLIGVEQRRSKHLRRVGVGDIRRIVVLHKRDGRRQTGTLPAEPEPFRQRVDGVTRHGVNAPSYHYSDLRFVKPGRHRARSIDSQVGW